MHGDLHTTPTPRCSLSLTHTPTIPTPPPHLYILLAYILHQLQHGAIQQIVPIPIGQKHIHQRSKQVEACKVSVVKVILECDTCTYKANSSHHQPCLPTSQEFEDLQGRVRKWGGDGCGGVVSCGGVVWWFHVHMHAHANTYNSTMYNIIHTTSTQQYPCKHHTPQHPQSSSSYLAHHVVFQYIKLHPVPMMLHTKTQELCNHTQRPSTHFTHTPCCCFGCACGCCCCG